MATAKKAPAKKKAPEKAQTKAPVKINQVAFLIDASVSMQRITRAVKNQIVDLKNSIQNGTPSDQQVEFSVFTFGGPRDFRSIYLNRPIKSVDAQSVADTYSPVHGSTALVSASVKAIEALNESGVFLNKANRDVTKLLYVITDGDENSSDHDDKMKIRSLLSNLGDRWTVAILVPDHAGKSQAERFGFPSGNIEVWDATSSQGVEIATRSVVNSYADYSIARSQGFTRSSTLFRPDASALKPAEVRAALDEFNGKIYPVRKDSRVDEFVANATGNPYRKGSAYYEITKPELVQGYKKLAVRSKTTEKTFSGDQARDLLGIGKHDMKVGPGNHGNWRIFIQSTSLNRKLIAGTSVLVENG